MLITTTSTIEGQPVQKYLGIVGGEVIVGADMFKDLFAAVRDVVGGRSRSYEHSLQSARDEAMQEMQRSARELGADAVIAVDFDYEVVGKGGSMMMVCVCGTAVKVG